MQLARDSGPSGPVFTRARLRTFGAWYRVGAPDFIARFKKPLVTDRSQFPRIIPPDLPCNVCPGVMNLKSPTTIGSEDNENRQLLFKARQNQRLLFL